MYPPNISHDAEYLHVGVLYNQVDQLIALNDADAARKTDELLEYIRQTRIFFQERRNTWRLANGFSE